MADLNFNTALNASVNTMVNTAVLEGVATQLAAGITGAFFRPLNAGPLAFASLPGAFNIALGTLSAEAAMMALAGPIQMPAPQAKMTATLGQGGQGDIDLGDGYKLHLNQNNSEVDIIDQNTGHTTQIWGDPHVNVDGKQAFNFAGTTTFNLGNGTKITINTQQWAGNPNAYVANQLVITKGNQAIVVDGLSQNKTKDLSISMSNNGRALDAATRDGYVLNESADGKTWNSEYTGKAATQDDMNATMASGAFAPGSTTPSLGEMGNELGQFLSFGVMGSMLGQFALASASASVEARAEAKFEHKLERAVNQAVHQLFAAV